MSNLVFPSTLPGLSISIEREDAPDVRVQRTISNKELRFSYETYPVTRYRMGFEVLRSDASLSTRARELQQVLTHIARHYGMLDSFLLIDPADSSVTDMGFAVGDGVTASFQLQRSMLGDVIDAAGFEYTPQSKPYTNMLKNSSFEASSAGLATNWGKYGDVAGEPAVATIVPGMNGGSAQRISWGIATATQKGIAQTGTSTPAFVINQWYTVSFFARASGSNIGKFVGMGWNTFPSQRLAIACPALSASWQRYVFQILFAAAPTAEIYFSITNVNTGDGQVPTSTFGDLDFDLVQVVTGQHGVGEFQPIETPAAATGTRTPAYWPAVGDGFEPIFERNGDVTVYEDGTWRGRRTLYPFTRSNLLPFSEQFDNAAWVKTNATIVANSTTAPDGTATADTFNEGAAVTVQHFVGENVSDAIGALQCYSVFVKANNLPNIFWGVTVDSSGINFNLGTGVIDSTVGGAAIAASGVQTSPLWPGWYRIWFTRRAGSAAGQSMLAARGDGAYTAVYTGTSRTFFAWGAMAERVSNLLGPTPYIPTPSSAAVTVTDYSLSSSCLFTPAAVPAAGTFYSFDGSYYRRVRFAQQVSVEQIVSTLWKMGSLELLSVKP